MVFAEGCVVLLKYHPIMQARAAGAARATATHRGVVLPAPALTRQRPGWPGPNTQLLPSHELVVQTWLRCAALLQPVAPFIDYVLEPLARRGYFASSTNPGA